MDKLKFLKKKQLFPINSYELKKFIPISIMMFCVLFNYTLVRDLKDAFVVNAAGAETISFIKFWVVLPSSVLSVILYNKMHAKLKNATLYYVVALFITFFVIFGVFLYPARDYLLPSEEMANKLIAANMSGLRWFINIRNKWLYVLFYTFAELWGSVSIGLLFWQFANRTINMNEAKRFYPFFSLMGNWGLILAGQFLIQMMRYGVALAKKSGGTQEESFNAIMPLLMLSFAFFGFLMMFSYYWLTNKVLPNFITLGDHKIIIKKKKPKLSVLESVYMIAKSKYLLLILITVISYGVGINLTEISFKDRLKISANGSNTHYTESMGKFSMLTGFLSIITSLTSSYMIRTLGWLATAIMTPIVLLVGSGIFFSIIMFDNLALYGATLISTSPATFIVALGGLLNSIMKSCKYAFFDTTKEMAYIPLDYNLKNNGKAAIDVIGGRLGKSGGAAIQQLLLLMITRGLVSNGQEVITPFLFVFVLLISIVWFLSVIELSKEFKKVS